MDSPRVLNSFSATKIWCLLKEGVCHVLHICFKFLLIYALFHPWIQVPIDITHQNEHTLTNSQTLDKDHNQRSGYASSYGRMNGRGTWSRWKSSCRKSIVMDQEELRKVKTKMISTLWYQFKSRSIIKRDVND